MDAVQSMVAAVVAAMASASPLLPSSDGAALDPSAMVRTLSSSGEAGVLWNSVHQSMLALQQKDLSVFFSIAGAPAYATGWVRCGRCMCCTVLTFQYCR